MKYLRLDRHLTALSERYFDHLMKASKLPLGYDSKSLIHLSRLNKTPTKRNIFKFPLFQCLYPHTRVRMELKCAIEIQLTLTSSNAWIERCRRRRQLIYAAALLHLKAEVVRLQGNMMGRGPLMFAFGRLHVARAGAPVP